LIKRTLNTPQQEGILKIHFSQQWRHNGTIEKKAGDKEKQQAGKADEKEKKGEGCQKSILAIACMLQAAQFHLAR